MQPRNMDWVVAGRRYRTETATLLASDAYWNNYNREQNGRNTFLFRTPNGSYFAQHQTLVPGEADSIRPLDVSEAVHLYHSLGRQEVPFITAFPCVVVQDA